MLCKSCGAQIADNSVFCTNCGTRVQPVNEPLPVNAEELGKIEPAGGSAEPAVENQADAAAEGHMAEAETTIENAKPQAGEASDAQAGEAPDAQAGDTPDVQAGEAPDAQAGDTPDVQAGEAPDVQAGDTPDVQAGDTYGQPQANGMWNNQGAGVANGQPQMNGMPGGQTGNAANGQPQINGMPGGQTGNVAYAQPQANGMWNNQGAGVANGQPQMNGMPGGQTGNAANGQPQMNGMPGGQTGNAAYAQPQANGMWNNQGAGVANGQPQMNGMPGGQTGNAAYGQTQMNGMPYAQPVKPPKKPFVMPTAVNLIFGILAVAAAAVFVCILIFGKPQEKKSELAVNTLAIPAQQQMSGGSDELNVDFGGVTFEMEIPETEAQRQAQELAEGFIFADSDTRNLTEEDLLAHTSEELWYAYYEILARAGVDLSEVDDDMHEYFQRKNWYEPTVSLVRVLESIDEEQQERFSEMIENGEDPSYDILLEAGILNQTEADNMKLIEEYVTYGTISGEGPEDALEDMLEE